MYVYMYIHLIHKWRSARKSLGRVHESEAKGASIQMKTKQSMEMRVVSLEISCQLGSDSCLLMTAVEIPGFTTEDMAIWFRSQHQKVGKYRRKTASIISVSLLLYTRVQF